MFNQLSEPQQTLIGVIAVVVIGGIVINYLQNLFGPRNIGRARKMRRYASLTMAEIQSVAPEDYDLFQRMLQTGIRYYPTVAHLPPFPRKAQKVDFSITVFVLILFTLITVIILSFVIALAAMAGAIAATGGVIGPFALAVGSAAWVFAIVGGIVVIPTFGLLTGWATSRAAALPGYERSKSIDFMVLARDHPLRLVCEEMSAKLELKQTPLIGFMPGCNAYAIGCDEEDALILLGFDLVDALEPDEVAAVVGHELAHVASYDMKRQLFAEGFQWGLVFWALIKQLKRATLATCFLAGHLYVKSLSRAREFEADAIGAYLTSSQAMIGALEKITGRRDVRRPREVQAFLLTSPSSTHPSTRARISKLRNGSAEAKARRAMRYTGQTFQRPQTSGARLEPSFGEPEFIGQSMAPTAGSSWNRSDDKPNEEAETSNEVGLGILNGVILGVWLFVIYWVLVQQGIWLWVLHFMGLA